MNNVNVSLAELLKAEFMEKYGLTEDQISLTLSIYTPDVDLGRQILVDNNKYETTKPESFLKDGFTCDNSYGENVDVLWVFKKNSRNDFEEKEAI
jgi:hypothetical protein